MNGKINAICIIIFLLLVPAFLFAQSNFVKGRVITFAGDTLTGQINDRNWLRNPERITFKINKSMIQNKALSRQKSKLQ